VWLFLSSFKYRSAFSFSSQASEFFINYEVLQKADALQGTNELCSMVETYGEALCARDAESESDGMDSDDMYDPDYQQEDEDGNILFNGTMCPKASTWAAKVMIHLLLGTNSVSPLKPLSHFCLYRNVYFCISTCYVI